jgi:hypothetical protein
MAPADMLLELRRRPFAPFRIHLSDGTVYEVRHPEMVMVGLTSAIVATPSPTQPQLYGSYEVIDLRHVARLVPVEVQAQSGQAG